MGSEAGVDVAESEGPESETVEKLASEDGVVYSATDTDPVGADMGAPGGITDEPASSDVPPWASTRSASDAERMPRSVSMIMASSMLSDGGR